MRLKVGLIQVEGPLGVERRPRAKFIFIRMEKTNRHDKNNHRETGTYQ